MNGKEEMFRFRGYSVRCKLNCACDAESGEFVVETETEEEKKARPRSVFVRELPTITCSGVKNNNGASQCGLIGLDEKYQCEITACWFGKKHWGKMILHNGPRLRRGFRWSHERAFQPDMVTTEEKLFLISHSSPAKHIMLSFCLAFNISLMTRDLTPFHRHPATSRILTNTQHEKNTRTISYRLKNNLTFPEKRSSHESSSSF
jgi:hypothetical protein